MCPTTFAGVEHLFHCDLPVLQELAAILYVLYMMLSLIKQQVGLPSPDRTLSGTVGLLLHPCFDPCGLE